MGDLNTNHPYIQGLIAQKARGEIRERLLVDMLACTNQEELSDSIGDLEDYGTDGLVALYQKLRKELPPGPSI